MGRDSESVTAKAQNQRAQENAMKVVLSERKTETEISSTSNSSNSKKMCQGHTMAKTICSGAKSGERRVQIVVQRKGKERKVERAIEAQQQQRQQRQLSEAKARRKIEKRFGKQGRAEQRRVEGGEGAEGEEGGAGNGNGQSG